MRINNIKSKLIGLYHSYLSYKLNKQYIRYFNTKSKIEALEEKYMGVERVKIDWEAIEEESKNSFITFEELFKNECNTEIQEEARIVDDQEGSKDI